MSQSTLSQQIPDPSWVLEPITEIGVRHALILSADGIVVGASGSLGRDESEGMAAMVSALHGAARAAAVVSLEAPEETPISTVTVQLDGCGTLMVMPAGGANAFIAASFGTEVPMNIVAHTLARQAKNLGEALMSVPTRSQGPAS
ncbi:roadblock/LC7 domain-containing protein [Streptomyces cellulosae]|uniref:Roadblock/LC7 domain-containing protein n=2 Tax=Streptomyces TaxID=1883 RepID=A0ABW6JIC8_STRCE|nr:roadblock/LC7 domain-containing protein [Streptomyces sp. McG7]MBT2902617.1 roadblock/LC7 domain-containing protein [Streptomyces sp. McG8]MCP8706940.1 roadblock/LC7 domain-containing protein [Streptomyces sp. AC04842]MCX4480361.1 roadblock/LC7 domain-containing protein [Streptomyces cellulosae]MDN3284887.1 roadblock/LC7 domain-containing protein [Streptomyces thermocarboxydus]MDQ0491413.1 putative regulator of Ras-like GTPase activity (Roadblock/LC7/MglB family) [Streptomyces thermodiastat